MKSIDINEEKLIVGGGSITGAIVSALKGYITGIFTIGQNVGGAIRRIITRNICGF